MMPTGLDWVFVFAAVYFLIAMTVSLRLDPRKYETACDHASTRQAVVDLPMERIPIADALHAAYGIKPWEARVRIPKGGWGARIRWLLTHDFDPHTPPPSRQKGGCLEISPYGFPGDHPSWALVSCPVCLAQSIALCGSCGRPIAPGMEVCLLRGSDIVKSGHDPQISCEGSPLAGVREIRSPRQEWRRRLLCCADCSPNGQVVGQWVYPGRLLYSGRQSLIPMEELIAILIAQDRATGVI